MSVVDYKIQRALYAQLYSELEFHGHNYLAFRDIPNIIKNYIAGNKALDYGCGVGKSTRFLKSLGLSVEGVDINEKMIQLAQSNDPKGKYNLIKSANIPSKNGNYDLIFSSWVMMEISTKAEMINVVKEIARVLNENGIFIMLVCNENTYNNDWISVNAKFPENQNPSSGSLVKIQFKENNLTIKDYFWTEEDYKYVLEEAGMKIQFIHKPLGMDNEPYDWINETILPPFNIFVAPEITMCNTNDCVSETLCIEKESSMKTKEDILNCDGRPNVLTNASFKQVCEFPVSLCRRGSKDFITWINTLKSSKKSPLEIIQNVYLQIQSSFLLILVSLAALTIAVEACTCIILFVRVMSDPGFLFLFFTSIFISYLTLRIFTGKQKNQPKKKVKSKEI